jgi:tRNA(Arg) A34 adenosine deaminase TadA
MAIESYFRLAKKEALKSTGEFRLGACAVKSGRVFGRGFNELNKTNKIARKLFAHATIHAELASIVNLPETNVRGSTIYVIRIKWTGEIGLARPCERCMKMLASLGVRRVVYSTETFPYYGIVNVKDMLN